MSKNFALEIESIVARLQPIRLEVLQAEQHFREELDLELEKQPTDVRLEKPLLKFGCLPNRAEA